MNILLVDDHPMALSFYESILKENYTNCNIVKAINCQEACFAISKTSANNSYDIAIIDQRLPDYPTQKLYAGTDIINLIRKVNKLTKVILITGHDKKLLIYDIIIKVRPDGMVIKSDVTTENFIEIINIVLEGNKYQSQSVKECVAKIWENDIIVKDYNRKILILLAKGYKVNELHTLIPLAESTIKKRISSIKKSFQIDKNNDLIKEVMKRGLI